MTLDEAISHAEEVAKKNEKQASWFFGKEGNPNYENCVKCAKEHRQLAEWLQELKQLREQTRWNTVFESPKASGRYLAVHGGTNLISIDHYTTEEDAKEIDDEWYEEFIGWESQNVIKWMQLPKS